jgi:hypothetical protein
MTIDPTRDEWLTTRDALAQAIQLNATVPPVRRVDRIAEDVLGPCPPEPPETLRKDCFTLVETCGGVIRARELLLTPDEADAMAEALIEHARYAREQGGGGLACGEGEAPGWKWDTNTRDAPRAVPLVDAPICGRVLDPVGWFRSGLTVDKAPTCQRPEGHPVGGCRPHRMAADG